jgi:hypothetical protein
MQEYWDARFVTIHAEVAETVQDEGANGIFFPAHEQEEALNA